MKKTFILSLVILFAGIAYAQEFSSLRPRYTPFPVNNKGETIDSESLNGTWLFTPAYSKGFEGKQTSGEGWKKIEVPGEWVMQSLPVKRNTSAGYWREFSIAPEWKDKNIRIRFDAVYSDCTVWVNGKEVGGHIGGFTPFEVDITPAVKTGKNILALRVKSDSLADKLASGMKYASHDLGGISRKVTLFAVPEVNVRSLHVAASLTDDLKEGTAVVQLEISNDGKEIAGEISCDIRIFGVRPKQSDLRQSVSLTKSLDAGKSYAKDINISVKAPDLWHPEHPNLYVAVVELKMAGKTIETVHRKFGFRKIEVKGNQLTVNNVPIQLRGVCRHEVHPLRGRSLPEGQWRKDVEIFRAGNVNHIRTSHYPPSEELMIAADELGMFIEAEGPFCWSHGAGKKPAIQELTVRPLLELVERDRSHPSVLFWSLSNESHWNESYAVASKAVRALDPTRPQTFNFFPWGGAREKPDEKYCEIASDHYPGRGGPRKYTNFNRPVNFGEFCHLNAYNRHELVTDPGVRDAWGRGMSRMWENMWKSPGVVGGSLWAAIDDSFFIPDGRTVGYGTWGPIDGWRRPKPEYWHMKKAYSPVKLLVKEIDPKTPTLRIENRFDHTNINQLKVEWSVDGREWKKLSTEKIDIPARTTGAIHVPGKTRALRFTSNLGFVVDEFRLAVADSKPAKRERPAGKLLNVTEANDMLSAGSGDIKWTISKTTGVLTARKKKQTVLTGGPSLMVLSLNGRGGTQMKGVQPKYKPHTQTCSGWEVAEVKGIEGAVVIKGKYKEAEGSFTVRFRDDGTAEIDYDFKMLCKVNARQIGIVLDLPKAFDELAWERKGLWSYYPADHIGRTKGKTRAFEGMHSCGPAGSRVKPDWPWRKDGNEMGSNDFRSTKENIYSATLSDGKGLGVDVVSDGSQHVRAWANGEQVRLLIADHNNPGDEKFFRTHASVEDKRLYPNNVIKGKVVLRLRK